MLYDQKPRFEEVDALPSDARALVPSGNVPAPGRALLPRCQSLHQHRRKRLPTGLAAKGRLFPLVRKKVSLSSRERGTVKANSMGIEIGQITDELGLTKNRAIGYCARVPPLVDLIVLVESRSRVERQRFLGLQCKKQRMLSRQKFARNCKSVVRQREAVSPDIEFARCSRLHPFAELELKIQDRALSREQLGIVTAPSLPSSNKLGKMGTVVQEERWPIR